MAEPAPQRRLAAIVAADLVGYSGLMERHESGTLAALKAVRRDVVDPAIAAHRGHIIKTTGDGLLIEFPSVTDAVVAAVRIQRGLATPAAGPPGNQPLAYRIGINIGDVIVEDGDIYGDGVNIAVRLEGLCQPGGVVVSRGAFEQMREAPFAGFADRGEAQVKNIARPVALLELTPGVIALIPVEVLSGTGSTGDIAQANGAKRWLWALVTAGVLGLAGAALSIGLWLGALAPARPPADLRATLSELLPTAPREEIERIVKLFGEAQPHRAFAMEPLSGRHRWTASWPTLEIAEEKALEECELSFGKPCVIVASDNSILPTDAAGHRPARGAQVLHYAGPVRVDRIPIVRQPVLQRADVTGYAAAKDFKAMAIHPKGELTVVTGAASQAEAEQKALTTCNEGGAAQDAFGRCFLYASGDQVVLPLRKIKPMTP